MQNHTQPTVVVDNTLMGEEILVDLPILTYQTEDLKPSSSNMKTPILLCVFPTKALGKKLDAHLFFW